VIFGHPSSGLIFSLMLHNHSLLELCPFECYNFGTLKHTIFMNMTIILQIHIIDEIHLSKFTHSINGNFTSY